MPDSTIVIAGGTSPEPSEPSLLHADDTVEVVGESNRDGRRILIVRERRPSTAMLAAQVMTLTLAADYSVPHVPRVRAASKYGSGGSDKGDGRILPKLAGKSRNQPCPACGRKMKRCTC